MLQDADLGVGRQESHLPTQEPGVTHKATTGFLVFKPFYGGIVLNRKLAAIMLFFVTILITTTTSAYPAPKPISRLPDSEFFPVPRPTPQPTEKVAIIDTFKPPVETRPPVVLPSDKVIIVSKNVAPKVVSTKGFILDRNVSWYGPGFYGNRTACGYAYTKQILGVAHKTLPCGTKVEFMWKGKSIIVPVIDRGPYVAGRQWDLSGGLCTYLNHCFTGSIYYRILH